MAPNDDDDLNLFELAHQDVPPATLLAALMVDPATARLLVAWRRSAVRLSAGYGGSDIGQGLDREGSK